VLIIKNILQKEILNPHDVINLIRKELELKENDPLTILWRI
jgi:hypothetical protein